MKTKTFKKVGMGALIGLPSLISIVATLQYYSLRNDFTEYAGLANRSQAAYDAFAEVMDVIDTRNGNGSRWTRGFLDTEQGNSDIKTIGKFYRKAADITAKIKSIENRQGLSDQREEFNKEFDEVMNYVGGIKEK